MLFWYSKPFMVFQLHLPLLPSLIFASCILFHSCSPYSKVLCT